MYQLMNHIDHCAKHNQGASILYNIYMPDGVSIDCEAQKHG